MHGCMTYDVICCCMRDVVLPLIIFESNNARSLHRALHLWLHCGLEFHACSACGLVEARNCGDSWSSAFAASKSALSIHSYVDMDGVGPPSERTGFRLPVPRPQQTRRTHILSNPRPSRAITCTGLRPVGVAVRGVADSCTEVGLGAVRRSSTETASGA